MEQIELKVTTRDILGKKVKALRRQGITSVHLFGHGIQSLSLQADTARLQHVLAQAGHTRLINLKLNDENPMLVLVREVQKNPLTGNLLHVDFYQAKMTEKLTVEIPIILIGEAPALKSKENALAHELETLTIECLPAHIPSRIEVDISSLTEPGQAIRVKDIQLGRELTILGEPEVVVARISTRHIEVEEKVAAAVPEEAAKAAEAAPLREEKPEEE